MASGPRSLIPALWDEYNMALSMGLHSLGTYNPLSVLPESGHPSDHAKFPSQAFDMGGPAGTLSAFFNAMVGRPGVKYVIYQDRIWSPSRGVHAYTSGGHETHVHVSGYPEGAAAVTQPSSSAPGGTWTEPQLQQLWVGAGGNPRAAALAARIAMFESRGNPRARNPGTASVPEDSRGLWQINVKAHPQWAPLDLYDPKVNVRAAIQISRNGLSWSPWTTAPAARASFGPKGVPTTVTRPGGQDAPAGGGGIGGLLGGAADAAGDMLGAPLKWGAAIVNLVQFITDPTNWLRLVEVAFGFTLVMSGLGIFVLSFTKSDSTAGKLAGAAAGPGGLAAKTALAAVK